jgi:hypothetical protein
MPNYTHLYEGRPEEINKNIITEEFFSGSDVSIYINGSKVDFISSIGYTLQEQLKPIYGYASRIFDDVAVGSRVVVGTIRVPVKNPEQNTLMNYLVQNIVQFQTAYDNIFKEEYVKKPDTPSWVDNAKNQEVE